MDNKGKAGQAPGLQKSHEATRTNPETGQVETRQFTQAEWKARNRSEGWERPDGDEAEADEPGDPGTGGTGL